VGIDAVDVARFRTVLARRPRMTERLFTDLERAEAARRRDPAPALALRFASKEAVMKALGVGLGAFPFADVEVRRRTGGAPALVLSGGAARLAAGRGVSGWYLSLTDTDTLAIAIAVAWA
jgi:holo-[acyl-carrier protein] synthase